MEPVQIDLNKLKVMLPHGSHEKIASLAKVPLHTVRNVMAGRYTNTAVIKAAIKVAKVEARKRARLNQEIKLLWESSQS